MMERSVKDHCRGIGQRDRRQALAIGKRMQIDQTHRHSQALGQAADLRGVLGEAMDLRADHGLAIPKPASTPAASTAKPKSEGSEP